MILSLSLAKLHDKTLTQINKMEVIVSVLAKLTKNQEIMKSSSYAWLYGTKCVLTLVPTYILFVILLQIKTLSISSLDYESKKIGNCNKPGRNAVSLNLIIRLLKQ